MWKSIDKEMGAGDEEGVDPYKRRQGHGWGAGAGG